MSRPKYLWRVTGDYGTNAITRHYQSPKAARERADRMRSGSNYVAPALSVKVERSDRITFADPAEPTRRPAPQPPDTPPSRQPEQETS